MSLGSQRLEECGLFHSRSVIDYLREISYDTNALSESVERDVEQLTDGQEVIYKTVVQKITLGLFSRGTRTAQAAFELLLQSK